MTVTEKYEMKLPKIIHQFPFDIIKMIGSESIDFLQRITTNDFAGFVEGKIQKTLLVTDKGRIFDAVWLIHRNDHFFILVSKGMASEIIDWLNKYIIMEDITLNDVSNRFEIDVRFDQPNHFYKTDYFGFPVSFELKEQSSENTGEDLNQFERWRIENGIPKAKKELVQDFNPLELNLWNWISFTKGCYIGQEVIARLDTYNKIQRTLCQFTSDTTINEQEALLDENGIEIGKITSIVESENKFIGLAVVRVKFAAALQKFKTKESSATIVIEKVFQKEAYGRN